MPVDRLLHPRLGHSEKVNLLTDLEYRVWTQMILSADDFGVLRASAVTLQADSDHLANRPLKIVQRCIDAVVKRELFATFTHQGRVYAYQPDWQKYQKIEYPRATNNPAPTDFAKCDEATAALFAKHPGGNRKTPRGRADDGPKDLGRASRTRSDNIPPTRAGTPAERLTANGTRLTANGYEDLVAAADEALSADVVVGDDEFRMDVAARELVNLYPAEGRCSWKLVEPALFKALTEDSPGMTFPDGWDALKARLEAQKCSHRWRVKNMIPRLDRWLHDGTHLQVLSIEAPASERMSKSTATTLGGAAEFIAEAKRGA
jgi:hypothetical protein